MFMAGERYAWGEIWEPLLEKQAVLYTKYSIKESDIQLQVIRNH